MIWSGLIVLLAFSAMRLVSATHMTKGGCPSIKPMEEFNITKLLEKGETWYEIGQHNRGFHGCGDCVTYAFTHRIDGFGLKMIKSDNLIAFGKFNQKNEKGAYTGLMEYEDFTNDFLHLYIINTDYECVTTIYTCHSLDNGESHISSSYLLSTSPFGLCYRLKAKVSSVYAETKSVPDMQFEFFQKNDQSTCGKFKL